MRLIDNCVSWQVRKILKCEITALLGTVQQQSRIRETMQVFNIQTVYHAAAYKHVPIVEQNLIEGISNNVIGTWNMVHAAIKASVRSFVLVSTDKAVNPTSVMGATKRLAEIVFASASETLSTIPAFPWFALAMYWSHLDRLYRYFKSKFEMVVRLLSRTAILFATS